MYVTQTRADPDRALLTCGYGKYNTSLTITAQPQSALKWSRCVSLLINYILICKRNILLFFPFENYIVWITVLLFSRVKQRLVALAVVIVCGLTDPWQRHLCPLQPTASSTCRNMFENGVHLLKTRPGYDVLLLHGSGFRRCCQIIANSLKTATQPHLSAVIQVLRFAHMKRWT